VVWYHYIGFYEVQGTVALLFPGGGQKVQKLGNRGQFWSLTKFETRLHFSA
jgi:hypothetical protein